MILFSGMRPTGRLHLGHLVGALGRWVEMQDEYDCYFTIADYHALTTSYEDTSSLPEYVLDMALTWRAAGIDFARAVVFVQSDVKEHAELHLLLSMLTPMSWLERDPTLKAMQSDLHIKGVNYGLMGYPVLQAADILLYKAQAAPVGIDQAPHVELAREIARAFNRYFGVVFPEPEAILSATPRLLGTDGRKMSKSLGNCVYLDDPPDVVASKIMGLATDPKKVHATDPGDPDICSAQDYHKVFSPADAATHDAECRAGRIGCVTHKRYIGGVIAEITKPIREKKMELSGDKAETIALLKDGAERARAKASATMAEVRRAVRIGEAP